MAASDIEIQSRKVLYNIVYLTELQNSCPSFKLKIFDMWPKNFESPNPYCRIIINRTAPTDHTENVVRTMK